MGNVFIKTKQKGNLMKINKQHVKMKPKVFEHFEAKH